MFPKKIIPQTPAKEAREARRLCNLEIAERMVRSQSQRIGRAMIGRTVLGAAVAVVGVAALAAYWRSPEPAVYQTMIALPAEIHYAPAENLERRDVDLINSAGETIDMAAYVLTD
jgi:hypothetical protein